MKVFWLALLLVACFATLQTRENNGQIEFSFDYNQDMPVGVHIEGIIDPFKDSDTKMQAFLRIGKKYIPFSNPIDSSYGQLTYQRQLTYKVGLMKFFILPIFGLYYGWLAEEGTNKDNFYEVIYSPFILTGFGAVAYFYGIGAHGGIAAILRLAQANATIYTTLYREGKACFRGNYTAYPVLFNSSAYVELLECQAEISDIFFGDFPSHFSCNSTPFDNFTIYEVNLTDTYIGDLFPETCIGFD